MKRRGLFLLLAVLVLAAFLTARFVPRHGGPTPQSETPAFTPTPLPALTTPPIASPTPLRHRLAGVAQGKVCYAAVEGPDGSSGLYRVGEEIPGLGRLLAVDRDGAVIEQANGPLRLRVAPGPTSSPTPAPRTTSPRPSPLFTATPRTARAARTVSGSLPSNAAGRSAS